MKRAPEAFAVALANIVLPQPGGPCSNTPENIACDIHFTGLQSSGHNEFNFRAIA